MEKEKKNSTLQIPKTAEDGYLFIKKCYATNWKLISHYQVIYNPIPLAEVDKVLEQSLLLW